MKSLHVAFAMTLAVAIRATPALGVCGDGVVDLGEQCDDGNTAAGDCCSPTCQFEAPGSPCDDGNACTAPDTCLAGTCHGAGDPRCGAATDHFQCYESSRQRGEPRTSHTVTLADQFESVTGSAEGPVQLCNAADKNHEGVLDATAQLVCYRVRYRRQGSLGRRRVVVRNQFGDQHLSVSRRLRLCVPSSASAAHVNHFKCYAVHATDAFTSRTVSVADPFQSRSFQVVKAVTLCNPVDKNGEGIVDPAAHLTCYKAKDASGQQPFPPKLLTVANQFGAAQKLRVRPLETLCVPSLKTLSSPAGAFLDG